MGDFTGPLKHRYPNISAHTCPVYACAINQRNFNTVIVRVHVVSCIYLVNINMAQEETSGIRRRSSIMRRGMSLTGGDGPSMLEKLIHNAFDVFDTARIQEVDVRDLGTMIRALGCVMTEAELQEIQVQLEDVENNSVSQSRFVEYMTKMINEHKLKPAEPEELLKAFQFFDPDNRGYIMRDDLAKALMELGEPYTQDEVNEMMFVACDPATNRINYEHFINLLIVKFPADMNVYKVAEKIEADRLAAMPKKRGFGSFLDSPLPH